MNKDVRASQFRDNFARARDEPHQRYSRIAVVQCGVCRLKFDGFKAESMC